MTALCPHCKKELRLAPNSAHGNIVAYGKTNSVLTKCCNNFVRIWVEVKYDWHYGIDHTPNQHNGVQSDDWGNEKVVSK